MNKDTVGKESEARSGKTIPERGQAPSRKKSAEVGAITKSSGRTRANNTTSTNFPDQPVPRAFLEKLGEMHKGETELTLALPLVGKAAKSKDLKTLVQVHLAETKGHVKALDQAAESLGIELPSKSCKPITQLIKEAVKVIGKRLVSADQDDALIAVAQKIEQYEIASYTELCATAKEQNYAHELALLTSILSQEKLANDLLGKLINQQAPLKDLVQKASLKKAASPA